MAISHIDDKGLASMVDVGDKPETKRIARARGRITMNAEAFEAVVSDSARKGSVIAAATIAGIMAAKNTGLVIPLCHPLAIDHVAVEFHPDESSKSIEAVAVVRSRGATGVEMEALHAVSVALLTIYDMVKAVDKSMTIKEIVLVEKSGGKSGRYRRG
jgi:cyclic pyranopterin phosphate synthase